VHEDRDVIAEIFSETGLIVIAVVLLLLFGGTKLPQFARSLGSAKKEFEKGTKEGDEAADSEINKKS
jgi:sec-independent protein translocase protein TatA